MKFTLGPDPDLITHFNAVSKKRAIVTYDAAGAVSEVEVGEAIELAKELRGLLTKWLDTNHPDLLKP